MSEMLDRIANAIYVEAEKQFGILMAGDEAVHAVARAAIVAMREPTKAMMDAGIIAQRGEISALDAKGIWHAMTAAAQR